MILIFEQKHTKGLDIFPKMEAKGKKGGELNKLTASIG